jgi:hypothetical protein
VDVAVTAYLGALVMLVFYLEVAWAKLVVKMINT